LFNGGENPAGFFAITLEFIRLLRLPFLKLRFDICFRLAPAHIDIGAKFIMESAFAITVIHDRTAKIIFNILTADLVSPGDAVRCASG
jgi:hypothetical protein